MRIGPEFTSMLIYLFSLLYVSIINCIRNARLQTDCTAHLIQGTRCNQPNSERGVSFVTATKESQPMMCYQCAIPADPSMYPNTHRMVYIQFVNTNNTVLSHLISTSLLLTKLAVGLRSVQLLIMQLMRAAMTVATTGRRVVVMLGVHGQRSGRQQSNIHGGGGRRCCRRRRR